jgi:hypothetical protein
MMPAVNPSNAELLLAIMRLPVPTNKIASQLRDRTDLRGNTQTRQFRQSASYFCHDMVSHKFRQGSTILETLAQLASGSPAAIG